MGAKTAFLALGSTWENGSCESFNARFRDTLFNVEVFSTSREAQILIMRWRRHYNTVRRTALLDTAHPRRKALCQWHQRPTMHEQSTRIT